MQLSIIIVSYNTCEITRACLQSIYDSKVELEYEIILIDNASTDGSVEMVQREFTEVKVIANSTNNMFAKANNQGMEIAQGEYFLLLNSDTLVAPGNIEMLYRFIATHSDTVGCVGPQVLNQDGSVQTEGFVLASYCTTLCTIFRSLIVKFPCRIQEKIIPAGHDLISSPGVTRKTGAVCGCCMLIKADLTRRLGGFDERYEFYLEENDLCKMMKSAGYETWVCCDAKIIHLGGGSTASGLWANEVYLKSCVRYYKKHFSCPGAIAYILLNMLYLNAKKAFCRDKNRARHYRTRLDRWAKEYRLVKCV